ncbi:MULTISPECIES: GntR family transcriptional regulator [Paracoccus]|uniref:GntR family transcriptional regulator n=1 Tax=Paracoccus fontiphilus TaxID=1815556 RepID=A0ABV7ICX1_9RHOB|nr:GntR family transcriptional regulator [Paracoccus fontiphilus]
MKAVIARLAAPASLSETVRNEMLRLITTGALRPGARLNEVHLAEQLGVSRGPVREALRELEGLGLTQSRPRLGFYVTEPTDQEIVELYEVSPLISQALIRDFMTYSDADTCRAILEDVDSIVLEGTPSFSESLLAFRQRMLGHVHNRYLAEMALSLYRRFFIVAALVDADDIAERIERIIDTQRRFWSAMAARDAATAEAIMQDDAAYWLEDVAPRFAASRHRGKGAAQGR